MIRLSITVQNIDFVLQTYDRIKVYYDSSPGGTFLTELTDVGSRLLLTESRSVYSFDDPDGSNGRWYKVSYFNSVTSDESNKSGAMQGGAETKQIGWTFENYAPPPDSWGEVLTADDLRYTYLWGIDLVAGNGEWYTDPQIRSHINSSITEIERALTITIKKRVLKCQPADGVAYDEEEDAYPYRHDKWVRSGRLALRRRPVLSVERFEIFTITDQRLLDLKPWLRIDHRKGVLNWFPRTGAIGGSFTQPAFFRLGINQNMGDYPHGYKVDYTAGYADASKVPDDLRDIIGSRGSPVRVFLSTE